MGYVIDTRDPSLWQNNRLTVEGAWQVLSFLSARPEIEITLDTAMGCPGAARATLEERSRGVQGNDDERERLHELRQLAFRPGASFESGQQLAELQDALQERHSLLDKTVATLEDPSSVHAEEPDPHPGLTVSVAPRKRRTGLLRIGAAVLIASLGVNAYLLFQPRSGLEVFEKPWSAPADVPTQSVLNLAGSSSYVEGPVRYVGTLNSVDYFAGLSLGSVNPSDGVAETVCLYGVTRAGSSVSSANCVDRAQFDETGVPSTKEGTPDRGVSSVVTWGPANRLRD